MNGRRGYQFTGDPVAGAAASAGLSGAQILMRVAVVAVGMVITFGVVAGVTTGAVSISQQKTDEAVVKLTRTQLTALEDKQNSDVTALQTTDAMLAAALTNVANDVAMLKGQNSTIIIGGGGGGGDIIFQGTNISSYIASVNYVFAENSTHNLNMHVGLGMSITNDVAQNLITHTNTGVRTVKGVVPVGGGNVDVVGAGGVAVTADGMTSTVTIDGTTFSTAITNLQMMDSTQAMQITNLQNTDISLQTQIDALQMSGAMIADSLNGTTLTFNMTLQELILDVLMLQAEVADLQTRLNNVTTVDVPVGVMSPWTGTAGGMVPTNWLLCDGTAYNSTDHPALFTVIGTMYCTMACGMGEFRVPDMRGRTAVGKGGTVLNVAVGTQFGTETHALSTAELASHTHTGSTNVDGSHVHAWWTETGSNIGGTGSCANFNAFSFNGCGGSPGGTFIFLSTAYSVPSAPNAPYDPVHSHAFTTNAAGSGTAHNNVQPSLVVQYIIKAATI